MKESILATAKDLMKESILATVKGWHCQSRRVDERIYFSYSEGLALSATSMLHLKFHLSSMHVRECMYACMCVYVCACTTACVCFVCACVCVRECVGACVRACTHL